MERKHLKEVRKKEKAMIPIALTNVITAIIIFLKALLGMKLVSREKPSPTKFERMMYMKYKILVFISIIALILSVVTFFL